MLNLYEIFKTYPHLSRRLTCRDMLFTNYDCPQTVQKERFFIECNFIAYVISGRRFFHKNNQAWELSEGSCVFVKKGAHVVERRNDDNWCVMVFFIPDGFLKQIISENMHTLPLATLPEAAAGHVVPLDVDDLSRSFFFSMMPYFTQSPPPPEHLLELKFKELVLSLLTNKKNEPFLAWLNNLAQDKLSSIEEVMHNHYMFNLTSAEYAKICCRSLPTFNREFKKIFHDSPARWVTKKRLERASALLENTTLSVAEICYDCGFENQAHFSKVFKEKKGLSPLRYRAKQRGYQPGT